MRDIKVEIKRETLPSPQDIVEMKRLKIKDEMQEIVENESYDGYREFAEELLAEYTPDVALGALLRLAFRSELDQSNYPEIRSFSVDRKGHGAAVPRRGQTRRLHGAQAGRYAQVQVRPARQIHQRRPDLGQLLVRERAVPRCRRDRPQAQPPEPGPPADSRNRPRRRGSRSPQTPARENGRRRRRGIRPGSEKIRPQGETGRPAQTAPAAGDESAAPRRKLKTKIQTEPRPEIPDFSKMSNEGFDWSAFMKFDDGTAWGRDENGKGKGAKSVRKTPKRTVTAAQRIAAKGKKRK